MWKIVLFVLPVAVVGRASSPVSNKTYGLVDNADRHVAAGPSLGFDTVDLITAHQLKCLKDQNYKAAVVRIYNNGKNDDVGLKNLATVSRQVTFQLYVVPSRTISPAIQVNDFMQYGRNNGWNHHRIFLQITDPFKWYNNTVDNVAFINNFIKAAKERDRKVEVGIYTNWYDYQVITGNSNQIAEAPLWYWNTNGVGQSAETAADNKDFQPFGPFRKKPFGKQYGIREQVCGLNLNKNIFSE